MNDRLREAAQAALDALESCGTEHPSDGGRQWYDERQVGVAIDQLRAALAEQDAEPVAWHPISQPYEPCDELDIRFADGSVICNVFPQFDGDLWWDGAGTGEKFIDPQRSSVTHWRISSGYGGSPSSREWVGLTDEERRVLWNDPEIDRLPGRFARAIEAALRAKNGD